MLMKDFSTSINRFYLWVTNTIFHSLKLQSNLFFATISEKLPWKARGVLWGYGVENSSPTNIEVYICVFVVLSDLFHSLFFLYTSSCYVILILFITIIPFS
jgi:hypothetical protein